MKIVYFILAGSLALNIGLFATKRPAPAAEVQASKGGSTAQSVAELHKSSSVPQEARLSSAAVAIFSSNDTESLRDLLRDSGLPEKMIRDLVKMRIMKKFETQMTVFSEANGKAQTKQAWWKDNQNTMNEKTSSLFKQEQDEADRLGREASEESKRLLGEDLDVNQYQAQDLSFLSPEKIRALRSIEQDYGELIDKISTDTNGFAFESANEESRLILAEKKRDLEALLSPSELRAFEMRHSPTAQKLRDLMTQLDASESEYMKIFSLQKAFDDKYDSMDMQFPGGASSQDSKTFAEREAEQTRLEEKIKSIVGEARYKESFLKKDPEWMLLETVSQRLNLPSETPKLLYALKETTLEDARKIHENQMISPEEKKQSLNALVTATRSQVRSALGSEGTDVYLKNNGLLWLELLEQKTP